MTRSPWCCLAALWVVLPSLASAADTNCQGADACERECEKGNGAACAKAGNLSSADPLRAVGLFQRGCDASEGAACAALSDVYAKGKGIKADRAKAFAFQNQACEKKHGPSCLSLARTYEKNAAGLSDNAKVAQSLTRAAKLFQQACDAGSANGCGELSRLFIWGAGAPVDLVGGATLAHRGCEKGDLWACRFLGSLYERGIGVAVDLKRASDLYRKGKDAESRDEPLRVPPYPLNGAPALLIDSDPPGATITIDALAVGQAPVTLNLPAGEHQLEAVVKGLPPQKSTVNAVAAKETRVTVAWKSLLKIETTPPGAKLTIDGADAGKSPFELSLPSGKHTLAAELAGFTPMSKEVTLTSGVDAHEKLTLVAAPGAVTVDSTPPGASVSIDGAPVGVTPWTGDARPGKHALVLELAGYLTVKKSLVVKAGLPTLDQTTLAEEKISLSIRSTPGKAEVTLDRKVLGLTPWTGPVPVGIHIVELSLSGFTPVSDAITVESKSKPVVKDFKLVRSPPTLTVGTTPPGASVFVDDVKVGDSPFSGPITAGKHTITARLAGYDGPTETIDAKPAEKLDKSWELVVRPVTVSIDSVPPGATVLVDGAPAGVTPVKTPLLPGPHKVHLSLEGSDARDVDYQLAPGIEATWRIELSAAALAKADLPPPPPVPPPETVRPLSDRKAQLAQLADPALSKEAKQAVLKELAQTEPDLTAFVQIIVPAEMRGELCMEWQRRVYPSRLVVTAADPYKDPVPATLLLHGHAYGTTPFDGQAPSCITRVTVKRNDTESIDKLIEHLDPRLPNAIAVTFSGRPPLTVFSAFGDYTEVDDGFLPGVETKLSGGVRIDHWGRYIAFSLGIKVTTMYRGVLNAPVAPAADIFLGYGHVWFDGPVRLHAGFMLGVWSLAVPTARLNVVLNIKDHFYVSIAPDLRLNPIVFIPTDARALKYRNIEVPGFFFAGGSAAIGGSF